MTLWEYAGNQQLPIIVEHGRCGRPIGIHQVCVARGVGGDGHVDIQKSTRPHRNKNTPSTSSYGRGPLTAPRVVTGYHSGLPGNYARIWCSCLPAGHVEKMSVDKVAALYVTFPEWKWGRHIDLPVVTI